MENTESFTIYSSHGFIGFVMIKSLNTQKTASIILFETIEENNSIQLVQSKSDTQFFSNSIPELDILNSLLGIMIPNRNINGLTYYAIKANGETINL